MLLFITVAIVALISTPLIFGCINVRSLTGEEIEAAEQAGLSYADRLAQLEEELYSQGHYVKKTSPFFSMSKFKQPSPEAIELSQQGLRMLEITRYLINELGLTIEELKNVLTSTLSFSVSSKFTCNPKNQSVCYHSRYRSMDGSCNFNLPGYTNLGKYNTNHRRLLPAKYSDGIQRIRLSKFGFALPSARKISTGVFGSANEPLTNTTSALMQFGQFINHDFQSTPHFTFSNGTPISCCSSTNGHLKVVQPSCLPIEVPKNDPFFNANGVVSQTCMNFVRSIAAPRLDCTFGPADQLNSNTHWLDGSAIYGSNNATLETLRSFSGGLLLMTNDTVNKRQLLPTSPKTCSTCFIAGDSRLTEQPQLTVIHTLFAREHNRIATALQKLHPSWTDEILFQEARRIVIAEIQHITYSEFLPNLLSPLVLAGYNLVPLTKGFSGNYSSKSTIKSGPVSNEFATAAFRFGHSIVQGTVLLYNESGALVENYEMSSFFGNPTKLVSDRTFLDNIVRGLATQPSQSVDRDFTDELWNKLFKPPNQKFGMDLVALNIQRGRDHGLPSYNAYRQMCGFSKLHSFIELSFFTGPNHPQIKIANVILLRLAYASVDDIDLYVGGVLENPMHSGGIVGPTMACLIGDQFNAAKFTDRFFYELGGQPHSFTSAQLTEIRKASLSRIFCDNNDGSVLSMQPKAFNPINNVKNEKSLCTDTVKIPKLNLKFF